MNVNEPTAYFCAIGIYANVTITASTIPSSQTYLLQRHFTNESVVIGIGIFLLPFYGPIQLTVTYSIHVLLFGLIHRYQFD